MTRQRNRYVRGHRIVAHSHPQFKNGSAEAVTMALIFKESLENGTLRQEDRERWIELSLNDAPAVRDALRALGIH